MNRSGAIRESLRLAIDVMRSHKLRSGLVILGVGIDNGVHLLHRCRHDRASGVVGALSHTGRAIILFSATTMVGFVGLSVAGHQGLQSIGNLAILGITTCMLVSLVFILRTNQAIHIFGCQVVDLTGGCMA